MPQVRAWPYSLLVARRVGLQERFVPKYPHAWLVWEPVLWKPSAHSALAETISADFGPKMESPPDGEAHCFELKGEERILVGRAPGVDLRINDAAVSRWHFWLEPAGGTSWRILPASEHAATLLRGAPLPSDGAALQPGDEIRLGGVVLTFEDTPSLALRLDKTASEAGAK